MLSEGAIGPAAEHSCPAYLHSIQPSALGRRDQGQEDRQDTPNTAAAAPNVQLIHPGVLKYFREVGVVK